MINMDAKTVIIKAITAEAKHKPKERIFIGFKSYTYEEFASIINHKRKLDKRTRDAVEDFINRAVKMFNENEEFRKRMLLLAGE